MLKDFMKDCTCVLDEERADYAEAIADIGDCYVTFMPEITHDMWPMYVLECTAAQKFVPAEKQIVCFVPLGVHDWWGKDEFDKLITCFYDDVDTVTNPNNYDADLIEAILLDYTNGGKKINAEGTGEADIVFTRWQFDNGAEVILLFIADTPEGCWQKIIEKYDMHCDMLIESHKGFGDWFTNTPIYDVFMNTAKPELLPELYFKGKYTSSLCAEGFERLYDVPESGAHHGVSAVYKTAWNRNERREE